MSETIERQYFETYLAMVRNAVGTKMFRNLYVRIDGGPVVDAIDEGENACAFFVTSVLYILGKHKGVHATVASAEKDLNESGWIHIGQKDLQPGDVVIWTGRDDDNPSEHIGFYIAEDEAVSTSSSEGIVARHQLHFGALNRKIRAVYRMTQW